MNYFYSLLILMLTGFTMSAQQTKQHILRGQLSDSINKQPVSHATVSIVNARDSSLLGFTRTDTAGHFKFDKLTPGVYRLSFSQVNFHPKWEQVEISVKTNELDLGKLYLQDKSLMQNVNVIGQRPPVVVNGDTLEFNAETFKTRPNAMVEDMLKKMPGVEVDRDGTIRVNGRRINRVLVNGKDFFNGDPVMATRNLSADALDKVQVFDRPSDQAAFTGIDDGNSEKAINLKLKKDKKNALFGKAGIAAGNNERYDGQLNLNKFNQNQQLSLLAMANNTNRQGFALIDMLNFTGQSRRMMGGGGSRMVINTGGPQDFGLPVEGINNNQGITQTRAAGFNYNDKWSKKSDVNASYFFNDLQLNNERAVNRLNILPGNNFTWLQNSTSNSATTSNRFNFSFDQAIDSFNSLKLTSLIGYQLGRATNVNEYQSYNEQMLNNGFSNTSRSTNGYNTENNLLLKHKFAKKGRTLSLNGSMLLNDSKAKGTQQSINNLFENGVIQQRDTLNQVSGVNSLTRSYGINANYTEPLSKRSLLEFRGFYNINKGDLSRETYDFDKGSGKHSVKNALFSNAFESEYKTMGGGISLRSQTKKYGYTLGANLQYAQLNSRLKDSLFRLSQDFTDLLPSANFNYNFSTLSSLRLDYNSSTNQPSVSQLQPIQDLSDPLNIREGNPGLGRSYTHSLNLQYINAQPSQQKNLFAFIGFTATQNAIVNSDAISNNGKRTTTPVNTNGVYNINGNLDRGFRVKKLNSRIGLGGLVSYNQSINFINGEKNNTGTLTIAPRLSAAYVYKEILEITAVARLAYNKASYSLQSSLNNEYWRQVYELDATIRIVPGLSISNDLSYTAFSGRSSGFNTKIALWNASISKEILKSKKGELRLSAFDLLRQNSGIDRTANSNYIEDSRYKTLQRYFTLGFTYSLQKASAGGPRAVIRTF